MIHRVIQFGRTLRVMDYLKKISPNIFIRELISRPSAVGAICPSSKHLAKQMALQVPLSDDGLVIELGGGTGVITQALLNHGVLAENLMVIEFSGPFVQRLRQQFPDLNIVHASAADLCQLVPQGRKINAIVSSLPLCSLPPTITQTILQQWQTLLTHDGIAIQFSYHLHLPKWRQYITPTQTRSQIVWANLPPANITTFSFNDIVTPRVHDSA